MPISKHAHAAQVLRDIRGIEDVEEEFGDIRAACQRAALVTNPWRTICRPSYRPQLFIAITATLFQQWTGTCCLRFFFCMPSNLPLDHRRLPFQHSQYCPTQDPGSWS